MKTDERVSSSKKSNIYIYGFSIGFVLSLTYNMYYTNQRLASQSDDLNFFRIELLEAKETIKEYEHIIQQMKREKDNVFDDAEGFRQSRDDAIDKLNKCRINYDDLKIKVKSACPRVDLDGNSTVSKSTDESDSISIMCWFDDLLSTSFFGCNNAKSQQGTKCPFISPMHVLSEMKKHPAWSKISHTMNKRERKKLLNELSVFFHPDKMSSKGCPQQYGEEALKLLNSLRT